MASSPITSWQTDGEKMDKVTDFTFLSSKITMDSDCSHEIKRHSLLGRKAMTNPDSILKSRDITLPTKVHLIKALVFPVIMYGCESWTIKKAKCWGNDVFKLAKSKISLGKCHIALASIWVMFKYILILISNTIPQWYENRHLMILIPLDHEIFAPCFVSLGTLQCLWVYSLWELEKNLYPTVAWKLYKS